MAETFNLFERLRGIVALRRCTSVGEGSTLIGVPRIENPGRILIGRRLSLASRPVQTHLVTGPEGTLEIGDDVRIGHGAGVAAHMLVRIGAGTEVGPFTMIMDTDFHDVIQRNRMPEPQPIEIGKRVRIGSNVTILRGSVIGDDAVVEPGSVVSGSVPPGCVAAGVPARVTRRLGEASQVGGAGETGSIEDRVGAIVALTFGLKSAPSPDEVRDQVRGWDSLGALKLLLAVEEAFSVSLPEEEIARASRIADLTLAVERALERAH